MPEWRFSSYCDGSLQQQTEQYLKQHFGCREPLIRLYNQYVWDFYQKTPVLGSQVVFGKDGWMYEPWVVSGYYQTQFLGYATDSAAMASKFTEEAHRVLRVQQILEDYGVHLFECLVPSKDLIYPEYLPENQDKRLEGKPKFSARFFNEEIYTQLGINHLNLEQYFLAVKDTADFLLFPQTGTHWTKYASLFAADTLIRYMEHLGNVNIKNLVIDSKTLDNAQDPDDDLESLMNLARPLRKPQYWYAKTTTDGDTTATKPKIIVIGDSFWWNIATQLPLKDIFSEAEYWYYNSTVYYYPPFNAVSELDLEEELLTADFVILFYSASTQYRMNDNFTQNALETLSNLDDYVFDTAAYLESEIQKMIDIIHTSPQWENSIREKAVQKGKTFEQAVYDDAAWLIDQKIKDGTMNWPTRKQKKQESHGIQ